MFRVMQINNYQTKLLELLGVQLSFRCFFYENVTLL